MECCEGIKAGYIDDESNKKYAFIITECNNCGKELSKLKMKKILTNHLRKKEYPITKIS